jgi:alpha/beta superfamily hydrolase
MGHVAEWWKIPAFRVQDSDIYKKTTDYLQNHPEIDNLVGHSYGGSVALQLQKEKNHYDTTTYGAPVFDPIPRNPFHRPKRYANKYDIVAAADLGAEKMSYVSPFNPNPHSYKNNSTHYHTHFKMTKPRHHNKFSRPLIRSRVPFV